ncbi:hypothetical protein LMH87_000295 [Akanthomyces muscarius]|uniref:Uncharacterized protein n=1 Tax=Akanthomyces muscarius TaxID=2231603 RepID=A0A9W8UNH4_AKAMU|nr:hypothetical protein LMH87_000295 [Akanthomyces muscarius]KAJ4155029.1 hypothetical protein LMH87_000295 [Akanthomyces muscarius]
MYSEMLPMEEMGTNAWLLPPYPSHVQNGIQCPDYVRFSLIGITLGHRINRTTDRYQRESLAKSYWEYRGRVIQSLTESIQAQQSQPNNFILAGIMTLLLADAQHGTSLDPRCHLEAIFCIIRLRDGIAEVARAEHLDSLLICFMSTAVFANTSAPAHDLLITETQHAHRAYFLR